MAARRGEESRAPVSGVKRLDAGRSHRIVQFREPPTRERLRRLEEQGVRIVAGVPDNGVAISAPDGAPLEIEGILSVRPLDPARKLSPLLERLSAGRETLRFVVEFHRDVQDGEQRSIVLREGLPIRDNPDLAHNHLVVEGGREHFERLAGWDEVAYLFPATPEMESGAPLWACQGAVTANGPVGQYIAAVGDGWDGPGRNSARLLYSYEILTAQLAAATQKAEIERALQEWSRQVQVGFLPGGSPASHGHINILFGKGNHGDSFPFDGPGRVLAHTFYPAPPNPEPIAGDMHFDDDESWNVGARLDLFSIALHELGHALGLAHSDDPADVMYPYYKMVTGLAPGDIASIRQMYAAAGGDTEPPKPLELAILYPAPGTATEAASIVVGGTAGGGVAPLSVRWSSDRGPSGTASGGNPWVTPSIGLTEGPNTIAVTVADASGNRLTRSVSVTRLVPAPRPNGRIPSSPRPPSPPASPAPGTDRTAPTLRILSPATATVATGAATIVLGGTAGDNVGVTAVAWSSNLGARGAAVLGKPYWQTAPIPLAPGANVLTVTAHDAAGNFSWRNVIVTRK
jgi:hypothetical protein